MSGVGFITARDMVTILTMEKMMLETKNANLEKQLDEAVNLIEQLIENGGDHYRGCDCIWCLTVAEARAMLYRQVVAQACSLLEMGGTDD